MKRRNGAIALLALFAASAWAAPQAVVDAVQSPAWLERNGRSEPLAAGMAVGSRDRIRTGREARAQVRLPDGSTVKLGAETLLTLERIGPREKDFFAAALDVGKGAFRFTTDQPGRPVRRDVTIRVATLTAAIPGADVWGRSEADKDFVCLLEGGLTVSHRDGDTREVSEPLSYYVARRDRPPQGVAAASAQLARAWAAQTEIPAGTGALRRGGRWKVLLASTLSEREALEAYDKARDAGYPATIRPRLREEGVSYEVLLAGLPSETEARALAAKANAALGFAAGPVR